MSDLPSSNPLASCNPAPLIIGHRGSSALAPENTIASFARSLSDGADGFEFDVRLARDSVPVVIHDDTLQRTAGISGAVSDFSSEELKHVEVGSWFNVAHPDLARPEYAKETVPTLEQVLDLAAATDAILYLEMKNDESEAEDLASVVVTLLQSFGFAERVVVESFKLSAIGAVKRLNAGIRAAALFEPRIERPSSLLRRTKTVELAVRAGADEIALHHSLLTKRVSEKAAQSNLAVVVWTVDNPIWFRRAIRQGIHTLITNDPAAMIRERLRLSGV